LHVKKTRVLLVGVLALSLFSLAAMAGEVQINGSTTVGPIATLIQQWFIENDPSITITISATGSGTGIAALINGTTDIAMHSRAMKPSEFGQAVENGVTPYICTVARDKIVVVVNEANPIENITMEQLYGIWMGEITNWSELGGNDEPILFGSRDTSSGTYGVWTEIVLDDADYEGTQVTVVAGNPEMQEVVANNENAIGYVGLAFQEGVKVLSVDGIELASSAYPIGRALFISTNGIPTGDVATVVDAFMGAVGGCATLAEKFIPVWACECDCSDTGF
jgi:phosphate transport system substrate-binding protein